MMQSVQINVNLTGKMRWKWPSRAKIITKWNQFNILDMYKKKKKIEHNITLRVISFNSKYFSKRDVENLA